MAGIREMNQEVEVGTDEGISDTDSTYSDTESTTRSVASSIYDYEKSHGRTFHAYHSGKYLFPNDEEEKNRMDITYHAIRLAIDNKLFYAPVKDPKSVLDVGTGTGIWAIDFADEYPGTEVIGIDLSPSQPGLVPPNCRFEITDADEEWTFSQKFDLVHTRMMIDSSLRSWPRYFEQAFAALKPGGWVEAQEFSFVRQSDDNTLPKDSKIRYWEEKSIEGLGKIGLTGNCDPDLVVQQMTDAGFINITRLHFKWPVGPWPKDPRLKQCGAFTMVMMLEGIYGLSVKLFTQVLGFSLEDLEELLADFRTELKRKDVHAWWPFWVIYAQKPESASSN